MTCPTDLVPLQLKGRVIQVLRGQHYAVDNLVVDTALESIIRGWMTGDSISHFVFAYTGGVPIQPTTKSLTGIVATVAVGGTNFEAYSTRDSMGLRSIGTWRGSFTPSVSTTYDTLGLMSVAGTLIAATTFGARTLTPPESVETLWTLRLVR